MVRDRAYFRRGSRNLASDANSLSRMIRLAAAAWSGLLTVLGARFSGLLEQRFQPESGPIVPCTSHEAPRESWEPLSTESSLRRGDQNGPWLKPFLEKRAKAGSAHPIAWIPGPKGPVYYASRQAAEAAS